MVSSLAQRLERLCSDSVTLKQEQRRLKDVLQDNGYPRRVVQRFLKGSDVPHRAQDTIPIATITVPYVPNTSEAIRRILGRHKIRTAFRMDNTLTQILSRPKEPIPYQDRTNVVYKIPCQDCNAVYIGQTSRQLKTRIKEHQRLLRVRPSNQKQLKKLQNDSAIALHAIAESHTIDFQGTTIVQQGFRSHRERLCAESVHINTHATCINRSEGADISPIWSAAMTSEWFPLR